MTEADWKKKQLALAAATPRAPLQVVEIADDVLIGTLVRALTTHGLTITNTSSGRGLRIVRAPTPPETGDAA